MKEHVEARKALQEWAYEYDSTDNINEAIFMLADGTLISGEFDLGMRGLDHNCIISLAPDDLPHTKKWEYIHSLDVVRLVPETLTALVDKSQKLTTAQSALLQRSSYILEKY